jgi:GcrA cell cycle regulator
MSWTEERIALLQKLWLDGMSASRIATELADGLTRNAVIGKVYRLGLSGRSKTSPTAEAQTRPRQKTAPRSTQPRMTAPLVQGNTALAIVPCEMESIEIAVENVVVPITAPVTVVDLNESTCRWPIGDPTQPEFHFCGAAKTPGAGPYCAHHSRIAYQPHPERRRDKRPEGL